MVQSVRTKLTLDEFARIAGQNPLQFWGVQITQIQTDTGAAAMFQYDWQKRDAISRETVAQAIAEAEAEIEHWLGYTLLPDWVVDEWDASARPNDPRFVNLNNHDLRGFALPYTLERGWFITGGIRASTLIEAAAAIAYTNTIPPTTYNNLATVTVTVVAGTLASEVRVYYPGHAGDDAWEIRPINVTVTGTTAVITFPRQMAVIEDLLITYEVDTIRPAEGTDNAHFLTTVDVYRITNDPATQATLMWQPYDGCRDLSEFTVATGYLLTVGNPRDAHVSIACGDWDAATETFTNARLPVASAPNIVRTYYYAGLRDKASPQPTLQMTYDWARAVAQMAAARLHREPSQRNLGRFYDDMATDLAYETGADQVSRYRTPRELLNNPFGTRRGEVQAWQQVMRHGQALRRGVALTQ